MNLLSNLKHEDRRTLIGRNVKNISEACHKPLNGMNPSSVKKMMSYRNVPEIEIWRAPFIRELLEARQDRLEIPLENHELEDLLSFLCCS